MGGRGVNPKKLQAMMRQMGIEMEEIDDVESVIIRTADREIVFADAQVTRVTQQGQSSWQVVGTPLERKLASQAAPAPAPAAAPAPKFTDADVKLVMEQAKVSREQAVRALEEADGEPAEAIVKLLEEDEDSA
jgi:nascent polypeptide-associated complex subunit alpha